jgi:hypothetical protein
MNTQHKRVLTILAGCPDGATEHNLTTRLKVSQRTIDELASSRLVTVADASVRANGRGPLIAINRVRITDAGRLAMLTMIGKRGSAR